MASNFKFTESANAVLAAAQSLAQENANTSIVPVHIAASLLHEGSTDQANNFNPNALFANVLSKAGADVEVVARGIKRTLVRLPSQEPVPDDISFSPAAIKILREAQKLSKEGGDTFIGTLHLILPIIQDSSIAPFLKDAGSSEKAVKTALDAVKGDRKVDSAHAEESFETLSKYSTDLTALAEQGKLDPVIARDNEIRRVIRILSRRTKNNAVLIGEPGVGKTAIAEGLAQRIIQRDVPVGLLGAKLLSLDLGAVAAGASYKGQFEERVKGILNDAEKAENLILFIDEIHLITSGKGDGSSGTSAGELFKPALARGKIRVVGATTIAEYRTYIEKDQALVRRFGEVQVHEPDLPSAISILRGLKPAYELHHGTQISDGAIIAAATLAQRYMTTRRLPDSAIDLIDEAAASIRVQRDSSPEIIDRMQRQRTQIEIEIHALEQESKRTKKQDPATEERLEQAKTSLRKLDEEFAPILAEWQAMKQRAEQIQAAKERLESLRQKADRAERNYDIATASDIRHYSIPDLQAAIAKLEEQKKAADAAQRTLLGDDEVTADAIADVVARLTGIPANSLKESDRQRLLKLERRLGREVIGQPQAVSAVANAIRISRSGLANENKPTASFLFCGPSGTGKTQLVKSLATELFNDPTAITRIDGSEYSEKHSISRLIGSPPGYIGHDEGGQLTEAVRRKPFSIVLIDEIEKAHNSLSQLLLQIMDEGRLTDSKGNVVNFKNCIIILTSNLGSSYINALPPDSPITPEVEGKVHAAIKAHFLPEVLNRLDATIIFNPLTRKQVVEIVDIRLRELQQRMRVNGRKITLQVDAAAKSWLADIGFNPAYGARPLARAIQSELLNPLSKMILQGQILDGEVAEVTADNRANRLVIKSNHSPSVDLDDDMDVDDDVEDVTIVRQILPMSYAS